MSNELLEPGTAEYIKDLELKVEGLGQENTELESKLASQSRRFDAALRNAIRDIAALRSTLHQMQESTTELIGRLVEIKNEEY